MILTDKQTDTSFVDIQKLTPTHNYGIDALRIISMFMVVILHILGQGGVIALSKSPDKYAMSWLLEITAYCAVNCFALISGYVSYTDQEKPFRYYRYLFTWLQVAFYSFGITFLAYLCKPEWIGIKTLIKSLMPVTTRQYWYFNAYTGLFFLIPWLNVFVRRCTKKEMSQFVLVLFVVFSCYNTFARLLGDPFNLNSGYSCLWLVILYIIGAWMKKCSVPEYMKTKYAVAIIGVCVLITWFGKLFLPVKFNGLLISYTSPTILLMAVAYVIVFSRLKVSAGAQRWIRCFAPAAFGVYLIHVQPVVWNYFMKNRFAQIADGSVWMIPVYVIGCAVVILVVCLLIEKARIWVFRFFKVDRLVERFGRGVEKAVKKIG